MNKAQEDKRRHKPEEKPDWKLYLETMKMVKEVPLPDGAGVRVEFVDVDGNGKSVDITGEDFEEYQKTESPEEKPEKPAKKSEKKK